VLAPMLKALRKYAGELAKTKKPEEVRDVIARMAKLSGSGPAYQELGSAAVGILGVFDDEGIALYAFAEGFPSVDVKKQAIQQLGQLAQKVSKRSNIVSYKLATLLKGAENVPAVRATILNLLTQPYIMVATEPVDVAAVVAGYLEKGTNPELTEPELRDCARVLGKRRTDDARKALLALAKTSPKPQVRQVAIEEGLLPWAREDETLHTELVNLVVDKEQPLAVRKVVIDALGKRGGRRSALTLDQLAQVKDLDPVLQAAIKEAKLVLLERLATFKANAADAPDQKPLDLDSACKLLERESGGDPERLEPLAGTLVKACTELKLAAGTARYRYATLYARLPADKRKEPVLLQRYKDAAENAVFDKLPPELREKLLLDYRELLRTDKTDAERSHRAMECSRDLAKLALEAQANQKAAGYLLDAAEAAVGLNDAAQAVKFLDDAKATGGLVGDLVPREQDLRTKVTKG